MDLIPKYSLISQLFKIKHPIIPPFKKPDVKSLLENNQPHTKESIYQPTGLPHYDFWKSTILKHGEERALEWLTIQKEFL